MKAATLPPFRSLTARIVLLAFAPFALDGCLSIGVDHAHAKAPSAEARCSLEARLYETGKDAKGDVKSPRDVKWKLFRLDASPDVPVREGTGSVWSATDLTAGKYRIAASWGPKPGVADDTSAGSGDDTFSLKPGDAARADFVLKKFPVWVVVGVLIGVVAIVAILAAANAFEKGMEGIHLSSGNTPDRATRGSDLRGGDLGEKPAAD